MIVMKPSRAGAFAAVDALASNRSAEASSQPYCGVTDPEIATTWQCSTAPFPSIASAITWPPSSISPGLSEGVTAFTPGSNRRSKVMRVYWSFEPGELLVLVTDAPLSSTEQSFAFPAPRLDSYWQDRALPSSVTVTVTFSHQG